jgi:hypothetical protein
MGKIPDKFKEVVVLLAQKLEGHQYAIRGTASLVLQGLDFNVEDIDVVCDEETARFLIPDIKYSETDKFKSFFGKLEINGVGVEVMGNWQIKNSKGEWSRVYDGSARISVEIDGQKVFVTTLESELEMFLFMERWSAYHKLKKQMELRNSNQQELFDLA